MPASAAAIQRRKKSAPSSRSRTEMNSSLVWACAIEPGPDADGGAVRRGRARRRRRYHGAVVKPRATAPSRCTHGSDSSVSSGARVALHADAHVGHDVAQDRPRAACGVLAARRRARRGNRARCGSASGTMLILLPPRMVPTLTVVAPSVGWARVRELGNELLLDDVEHAAHGVDGVAALLRRRAVAGDAGGLDLEPERALVRGDDAERRSAPARASGRCESRSSPRPARLRCPASSPIRPRKVQ